MTIPRDGRRRRALLAGALAGLVVGCASAPPEHFYRLDARAPSVAAEAAAAPNGAVLLVGAVTLPELVDRPQLVTLGAGPRVQVSETHRWAEPLKPAIGRVVADRLAAALGAARVYAHPQSPPREPDLRVTLQVQRFDAELGVAVNDEVLWSVRRLADGELREGRSAVRIAVDQPGHAALVAAHAAALEQVARQVAQAASGLLKP